MADDKFSWRDGDVEWKSGPLAPKAQNTWQIPSTTRGERMTRLQAYYALRAVGVRNVKFSEMHREDDQRIQLHHHNTQNIYSIVDDGEQITITRVPYNTFLQSEDAAINESHVEHTSNLAANLCADCFRPEDQCICVDRPNLEIDL